MNEKIDSTLNITEENNELTYQVCDIYKSSNKRVYYFCRSMVNHTRKNKDYYKKYIDNLLNNYRTNLSKDEIEKCFPTLDLISKQKPELTKKVEDFKKELETLPYFKDDSNEWSPINKLNTNYSDISELVSYIVEKHFKGKNSDFFFTKLINKRNGYQYLEDYKGDDVFVTSLKKQFDDNKHLTTDQFLALSVVVEDVINHDFFIKEGLEKVFSKNIVLTIDEIKTFVNNTIKNTYEGDVIENLIEGVLFNHGWKIVHKGGNGDFIDMRFGIDLIVEKNGIYKFVQTKKVWDIELIDECVGEEKGFYKISGKVSDIREDVVDLLGMGTMDGKYIIVEKQNEILEDSKKYRYSDKKNLPSPKMGHCYLKHPFENMKKLNQN